MNDLTSMLVPLTGNLPGWPAAEIPSVTESLLLIIGIPVLVSAVIAALVYAGRLARRGRGEQQRVDEPVWVGEQAPAVAAPRRAREIAAGADNDSHTGGASVRW